MLVLKKKCFSHDWSKIINKIERLSMRIENIGII